MSGLQKRIPPVSMSDSIMLFDPAYQLTRRNIAHDLELHKHYCGNLESPNCGRNWCEIFFLLEF